MECTRLNLTIRSALPSKRLFKKLKFVKVIQSHPGILSHTSTWLPALFCLSFSNMIWMIFQNMEIKKRKKNDKCERKDSKYVECQLKLWPQTYKSTMPEERYLRCDIRQILSANIPKQVNWGTSAMLLWDWTCHRRLRHVGQYTSLKVKYRARSSVLSDLLPFKPN